jgi:hypothetical protein
VLTPYNTLEGPPLFNPLLPQLVKIIQTYPYNDILIFTTSIIFILGKGQA